MSTMTPGEGTSTLATRLHIPHDRSAYQVSSDMFNALKTCTRELEGAAANLKTARDQAQVLHLLVDREGSKTCLENIFNSFLALTHIEDLVLIRFAHLYRQPDGDTDPLVALAFRADEQAKDLAFTLRELKTRIAADELWPAHARTSALRQSPHSSPAPKRTAVTNPANPNKKQKIVAGNGPVEHRAADDKDVSYQDVSAEVDARLTAKEARKEEKTRHSQRKRKRKSSYATAAEEMDGQAAGGATEGGKTGAVGPRTQANTTRPSASNSNGQRKSKRAKAEPVTQTAVTQNPGRADQGRQEAVAAAEKLTRKARRRQRSSGPAVQADETGRSNKRART